MKSLVFLSAFVLSSVALANNWYDRGNAGFAILCAGGVKAQTLDLYEVSERHGLVASYSNKSSAVEKAVDLLSRLNSLDPARAKMYRLWAQDFMGSATFVAAANEFVKTPDAGLVTLPTDCKLEQAVFQRNPSILNKSRYIVNSTLWNKLDADNQAALIVHEVIYREFMNSLAFEVTSERIRAFNSFIHADGLKTLSAQEYLAFLQELHFTNYEYKGLNLALGYTDTKGAWNNSILVFENGNVVRASLSGRHPFERSYFKFYCDDTATTPDLGTVTLNSEGLLISLRVNSDFVQKNECALPFIPYESAKGQFIISGTSWEFDANEKPVTVKGALSTAEQFQLNYAGTNYVLAWDPFKPVTVETQFTFDKEMNLRKIALGGAACRSPLNQSVIFTPRNFSSDSVISLDENGVMTSELGLCF
ncbi:hypothetical protein [Bdellovibrio sp. HCB-162]|uniref:hypothetical protein n=1 Tax=Bdellovibrio sp. HCB-162 TaxID=3394234 RepID=UPI0039BD3214